MGRLAALELSRPVTIEPMKAFPLQKDLVTDVTWNYEVKKRIKKFKPRPPDADDGTWPMNVHTRPVMEGWAVKLYEDYGPEYDERREG